MLPRICTLLFLILLNFSFKPKETDLEKMGIHGKVNFIQFEDGDSVWYNRNGMKVLEVNNYTRTYNSYDSDKNILEYSVVREFANEVLLLRKLIKTDKQLKYFIEYNPNLPKLIDSCLCSEIKEKSKHISTKICLDRIGKVAFKYIYYFDINGNLIEENYYKNREPIPSYTWRYTFNKFNKMTSKSEFNKNKLIALHKFYYNRNSLRICTKSYDRDRIQWNNDSSFYNSKNELVMEKYNWNDEDIINYYSDYKYDNNYNWVNRKKVHKTDTTNEVRIITYFE